VPVTCPRCGREAERREQFCEACGAFLGWEEGQPADSQLLPKPQPQPEEQRAAVQLRLENDLIEVAAGSAESTVFVVKNLGTKVEEFQFSVAGPEWVTAEPATVSVYPGHEAVGAVQAAPPRMPSCPAGVTPFQLTVTSALHSHLSGSAAGRVEVAPYYEFAADLDPSSTRGRGWTRHTITLENRGNTPLRILLDPTDVADGLRLSLSAVAEVEPGGVTEVPVAVHGRRRWFGRPEPMTFAVVAEAPKPLAPVRLAGTRVQVPWFPRWVPVAAAGVLVAAVAATAIARAATATNTGNTSGGSSRSSSPAPTTSAATTPSSGSSSPSPPAPVQVANVAGEPLQQAEATLKGQGLAPAVQALYDSSTQPGTVVKTDPPAGTTVHTGDRIQVLVDTGPNQLALAAPSASWTATALTGTSATVTLPFRQPSDTSAGAAFAAGSATLEDGTTAPAASVETIPPDLVNTAIRGTFNLQQPIIAGQHFRALVGFLKGTGGTVRYEVIVTDPQGTAYTALSQIHNASTHQLATVNLDLTNYAGDTQIALRVVALDSSGKDDVVWVSPRIEEWNAPPPPPATPAPTGSP